MAPAAADVVVRFGDGEQETRLTGSQIRAGADIRGRSYQLRRSSSGSGRTLRLTGMSISALLSRVGIDAGSITAVKISRDNGSVLRLTPGEVRSPPFPEGPALVYYDGQQTGFLRPVRASGGPNVQDHVLGGDIEVIVDGKRDLVVKAKASPRRADVGETITFTASVTDPPAGATLRYVWSFGAETYEGKSVTYSYDAADPSALAQVEVIASGGSQCAATCGGTAQVTVRVGDAEQDEPNSGSGPGSGSGDAQAGSSTGTGGGGQGGSGGGPGGSGTDPDAGGDSSAKTAPKPEPKSKPKPFGTTISGVLINDLGARVRKLPGGTPAGAAAGTPKTGGDERGDAPPIGVGGVLALAAFALGALRERRGVRLRFA